MSFFNELKERNVYKVAAAYAIVAWLIVQVGAIVLPTFEAPSWIMKVLIVLLIVGFPVALILAWSQSLQKESAGQQPDGHDVPPEIVESGLKKNRRIWLPIAVLAVIAVTVLFFVGREAGPEDTDGRMLAIFPFHIQGNEDIQYLSEGMSDLLSAKMDGVAGLQLIDPNVLIGYLKNQGELPRDPETAVGLAARFNAGKFIIGSVTQLGDVLRFSASLYDGRGMLINKAEKSTGPERNLVQCVDRLVIDLVAGELKGVGSETMQAGTLGTDNLEALKWYLKGEQLFRKLRFQDAMASYYKALDNDPSFALACFRAVKIKGWMPSVSLKTGIEDTLKKNYNNMPGKYPELYRAWVLFNGAAVEEVIETYEDLNRRYPNNSEIIGMLGEAHFHLNYRRGMSDTLAKPYFEQAMEYDAENQEFLVHLMNIYDQTGETGKMWDLYHRISATDSSNLILLGTPILNTTDSLERLRMTDRAKSLGMGASNMIVFAANNDNMNEVIDLGVAVEPYNPRTPVIGPMHFISLMTSGKFDQASQIIGRVNNGPLLIGFSGYLYVIPEIRLWADQYENLRKRLNGSMPLYEAYPFTSKFNYYETQCLLSALAGETDTLAYFKEQIRASGVPGTKEFLNFLDQKIKAIQSYYSGSEENALAHIDSAMNIFIPHSIVTSSSAGKDDLRYLKATILQNQGLLEESLSMFENFKTGPTSFMIIPLCYLKRAEIYDVQNRTEKAIEFYDRFLDFYKDCDDRYKDLVKRAQERRDALFKETL